MARFTEELLKVQDEATLRALAENMSLAPSNDVSDTYRWLKEHTALVGIAKAVEWYIQCAVRREQVNEWYYQPVESRGNCPHRLDWKGQIAQDRQQAS